LLGGMAAAAAAQDVSRRSLDIQSEQGRLPERPLENEDAAARRSKMLSADYSRDLTDGEVIKTFSQFGSAELLSGTADEPGAPGIESISTALEKVSVAGIVGLRALCTAAEESPEVDQVLKAVVCCLAGVDDSVKVGPDGQPTEVTREAGLKLLTKAGTFVNSLRRFPYAVKDGRVLPRAMTEASGLCAGIPEDLGAVDNEGGHLAAVVGWLRASVGFWQAYRGQSREQAPSEPPVPAVTSPSKAAAAAPRRPPSVEKIGGARPSGDKAAGMPLAKPVGKSLTAKTTTTQARLRTPRAAAAPASPAKAAARLDRTAPRTPRSKAGYSVAKPTTSFSPVRKAKAPRPAPKAVSEALGEINREAFERLHGPISEAGVVTLNLAEEAARAEDHRRAVEKAKREIRELKAQEGQLLFTMEREDKRILVEEGRAEEDEIMKWRWQEAQEMKEFVDQQQRVQLAEDLTIRREAVEWKREVKVVEEQKQIEQATVEYQERTEQSAIEEECRLAVEASRRDEVYEHLDKYEHARALRVIEKAREVERQGVEREFAQTQTLSHAQNELQRQKDEVMRRLELSRKASQRGPKTRR